MCTNNTNDNNNSSKVPLSTFEDLLLYMKNNGYNKIVVKPERGVGGNGQVLFEKTKIMINFVILHNLVIKMIKMISTVVSSI